MKCEYCGNPSGYVDSRGCCAGCGAPYFEFEDTTLVASKTFHYIPRRWWIGDGKVVVNGDN